MNVRPLRPVEARRRSQPLMVIMEVAWFVAPKEDEGAKMSATTRRQCRSEGIHKVAMEIDKSSIKVRRCSNFDLDELPD